MKKLFFILFTLITSVVYAQEKKAPLSPKMVVETDEIKVEYGQPSKRGRVIFGELEKYGKVWRTGANAATEVTFKKDVNFGGTPVNAGTYTLFTIPEEKEWTVILNSELRQFGAFAYSINKDRNVASVKVPVVKLANIEEKLIIEGDKNSLDIKWDDVKVSVPLKF